MECPKCSDPAEMQDSGTFFLLCSDCDGVWIDKDKLTSYLRERHDGRTPPPFHHETWPVQTELSCPSCEESKLEQIRMRGVEVERCPLCEGIFFDRRELERVAQRSLRVAKELDDVRATPPGTYKDERGPDPDDFFDLAKAMWFDW